MVSGSLRSRSQKYGSARTSPCLVIVFGTIFATGGWIVVSVAVEDIMSGSRTAPRRPFLYSTGFRNGTTRVSSRFPAPSRYNEDRDMWMEGRNTRILRFLIAF